MEQEHGADFVLVGCFQPSILTHLKFFPIHPMIATGHPGFNRRTSSSLPAQAGFQLMTCRANDINSPMPPEGHLAGAGFDRDEVGVRIGVTSDCDLGVQVAIAGKHPGSSLGRARWIG